METTRDFKGVWIPKEIWLDKNLNALDKCIFVEVDSLDNEEQGCFASNEYLAKFCQCSETKVSNAISKLIKLGYLFVKSFDGRQRILQSRLTKNTKQTYKICKADLQNLRHNNIVNNEVDYNNKKENENKSTAFDDIINNYTENETLRTALIEFIKMRKAVRKPVTSHGLELLLTKKGGLFDLSGGNDGVATQIVNQSIELSWAGFYPLKTQKVEKRQESIAERIARL